MLESPAKPACEPLAPFVLFVAAELLGDRQGLAVDHRERTILDRRIDEDKSGDVLGMVLLGPNE